MEDFQFLLYIVLGIIYMISKAIGSKNKKRQQPVEIDQSAEESTSEKPFSFEEILKEISKGVEKEVTPEEDTVKPAYEPIVEQKEAPKLYDREAERTAYMSYRQPVKEKKLFNEEPQESAGFLDLLNEEGGAAKAVVLSEIFNRKY